MWFVVRCLNCPRPQSIPFAEEGERDEWADTHTAMTGHTVRCWREAPAA